MELTIIDDSVGFDFSELKSIEAVRKALLEKEREKLLDEFGPTGLFDGEKLTLNENRKQGRRLINVKCSNCGAAYGYYSDKDGVCPYCGTPAKHE